jgi:hypothetical protein
MTSFRYSIHKHVVKTETAWISLTVSYHNTKRRRQNPEDDWNLHRRENLESLLSSMS